MIFFPLMGGCSWLWDVEKDQKIPNIPVDIPKISYQTMIVPKHSEDTISEIVDHLKAISLLVKLESRPPTSLNALYHRIKSDEFRLQQALREKGYFDGEITYSVSQDTTPLKVTLSFSLQTQYKISKISILLEESDFSLSPQKIEKILQLTPGEPVNLLRVQEANQRLCQYLKNHGYPYADMTEPEGEIDRDRKQIHLIFRPIPKNFAVFAESEIKGLINLSPQFVRNRIAWKTGESFDERKIDVTRRKLMGTGLFSSIEIKPKEENKNLSSVPLALQLTEGPPRTVEVGVKYATTEGLGGQTSWVHHNLLGGGEELGGMIRMSPRLSRGKVEFIIPDIFAPQQKLRQEISVTREKNRAYTSRSMEANVQLEHIFTDSLKGLIGVEVEAGKVKRANVHYRNRLIGTPFEIQLDTSNDLIDPTKGGRITGQITPYFGKAGDAQSFVVSNLKASYYARFLKKDTVVFATWIHGGTITTRSLDHISPNKRFYAGGPGSVRAYGYKLLGPLDKDKVPLGGRSLLEYGLEGRFKITDTLGCVVFGEAGNVSGKKMPSFSNDTRLWGLGVGMRYYTSVGPIRFDIATPMKRRRDISGRKFIDSKYQFYISVGQAF